MKAQPQESKVLTLTEAGALYNVQPETILKLAEKGKFQTYKLGKVWRVDKASFEAYLKTTGADAPGWVHLAHLKEETAE
jgi:excisionase family DNA binding protein